MKFQSRRSSRRQRDEITIQIHGIRIGDRGERDVAYYLNHDLRDNPDIIVIHDLRLEVDGQIAQIELPPVLWTPR